ncbi:MAG TPA: hypothetical protein PK095_21205, partial [Myxococcota bacterium]|nr:hypothetical protein [Myxococcota bacterium]
DGATDCDDDDCASDPACQAPVAGDSCVNPIMLMPDDGAWTAMGNLTGTADDISDYDTCTLLGESIDPEGDLDGQPDQVFEFTVPTDGRYTIEVLPDVGDDLVWALYSGATCVDATCVGYMDVGLNGDEEVFTLSLTANTNYYLVVDTFSDAPFGNYAVSVEGCVPDVACDGSTCGVDSCGTPCTCAEGTTCDETTDVCEAASTPVTIAGWSFGVDAGTFTIGANSGIAANIGSLFTVGGGVTLGTSATGNPPSPSLAVNTTGWNAGANTKYWQVTISTLGHRDVNVLSAFQRSSNTGPRDFKVQFSTDGTTFTDVADTAYQVPAETYFSAPAFMLPAEANNKAAVTIRWLVTSTTSARNQGGTEQISSTGT